MSSVFQAAAAAEADAELLDFEAQATRLIDEINAGLHSIEGDITEEAIAHEDNPQYRRKQYPDYVASKSGSAQSPCTCLTGRATNRTPSAYCGKILVTINIV